MEKAVAALDLHRLAVVGLAFRFPGPAGPAFWTALCEGRDLVTGVDPGRWALDTYHHPNEQEPGRSYTFAAGSLGDVSGFDATFFGISPREAAAMDPQQRLLLELSWEALESAGLLPSTLKGSRTGVIVGFSGSDYSYRHADDLAVADAFTMTGNTASIAANRISYALDLRGPSFAVDTACSSSLVAIHQARHALLAREADTVLVGAVNLHLHPLPFIAFSKATMLSKSGTCSPFDAGADGYVRAEGGAVLVLKRLGDALAHRDPILAVIAGSGINCDGRTNGITVPSRDAQAALLEEVYAKAGIDPRDIDYIEAHGTGTAVGDPIEARALADALGSRRPKGAPLRIGSVKSNVGHLETVAGMAGMVKAVLCLQHRVLPPSIHYDKPNPHIAFEDWNLEVVTKPTALDPDKKLVIGVNSFGFGGANAHVVLESFASVPPEPKRRTPRSAPFVVSARSDAALREAARQHAQWIRDHGDSPYYDLAWSAAFHRDWHAHRAIAFGSDGAAVAANLEAFAAGNPVEAVATGRALPAASGPVFVYSGNGSQWAGMGRQLLAQSATFRAAVARIDKLFLHHSSFSILEGLSDARADEWLKATECAQPLLFAVQVGLTQMLRKWGIHPVAVTGHSVGEIAAAWACGALTLEQAVAVVHHRSAWQGTTRACGSMTAVALGAPAMRARIESLGLAQKVAVAAVNSPSGVTVSGAVADLAILEAGLKAKGEAYRRLDLDYAFHSAAMDPIRAGVSEALKDLQPAAQEIPFHSTVTGAEVSGTELTGEYWWKNIREPVQLSDAIAGLIRQGHNVFVEVGPQPVLRSYLEQSLAQAGVEGRTVPTMSRTAAGADAVRRNAFQVVVAGCRTDLARLYPREGRHVELPRYPWQREPHWREASNEAFDFVNRRMAHPLLGYRAHPDLWIWENQIDLARHPWLADHRVGGHAVFPAAAFAEMSLAAAGLWVREGSGDVQNLEIRAPMVLESGHSRTVRLHIHGADGRFTIESRTRLSDDPWQLHAAGRLVAATTGARAAEPAPVGALAEVAPRDLYRLASEAGIDYGPAFRPLKHIWREAHGAAGEMQAPESIEAGLEDYLLHPAYLDAGFQLVATLVTPQSGAHEGLAFVPVRIGRLHVPRPRTPVAFARTRERGRTLRSVTLDCTLFGDDGEAVAVLSDVRFRAARLRAAPFSGLMALTSRAVPMPAPGSATAAPLASGEAFALACERVLHTPRRLAIQRRYYEELDPLLEALYWSLASDALRQLSGDGGLPEPEALVASGVIPAHRKALVENLLRVIGESPFPDSGALLWDLLGSYPEHAAEILWVARMGMHLRTLLRQAHDGPPGTDDAPLPCAVDFARAIGSVVAEAVESLPAGMRLRVLVVEGRNANTVTAVRSALDPERCDLTVATPDAFRAIAASAGSWDIVVAEGATAGPEAVDPMVASRLSAAGLLVFASYKPSRTQSLVVAAGEAAPPAAGPAIAEVRGAIERSGLRIDSDVPDLPGADGPCLVLARREPEAAQPAASAPAPAGHWTIVADAGGYSRELASALLAPLRRLGHEARVVTTGSPWPEVFESIPATASGGRWIVDLASLQEPDTALPPAAQLARQVARCDALARLLECASTAAQPPALWVVTERAAASLLPGARSRDRDAASVAHDAPVWGFARTAMNEYPKIALRLVDLALRGEAADVARALAATLANPDAENEIVLAYSGRHAIRMGVVPLAERLAQAAHVEPEDPVTRLDIPLPGQLKSIGWTHVEARHPGEGELEIEVRAAGLNFRDVMLAMGQLPDEALEGGFAGSSLGMELSGVVRSVGRGVSEYVVGDEVIAFAPASFATRAITRADAVVRKPPGWSFAASASVPIAFLTAWYALHHLGHLARGESILIHGAAGGVGIAAIQIAQHAGAEVYATAGSEAKREILRLLGVAHVYDSRSPDFAERLLAHTGGQGVDLVLNSLAGDAMHRSIELLRPLGRFLELGKRDIYENAHVGLHALRNNITYHAIDVDQIMLRKPALTRRLMAELMAQFDRGVLKPLPVTVFPADHAIDAFRLMQQSKHIGKIVLDFDPPPAARLTPPGRRATLTLRSDATYLVTGGTRGVGFATAEWLVARGARHLVLTGRGSAPEPRVESRIAELVAQGIAVRVATCDVADLEAMRHLLDEIRQSMPPLRGVVHAAALIEDGLVRNTSERQLRAVFAPKIQGAANLHELTRSLPLEFFVLYSSATTVFGNPGQSAYVAANRYLEVLAESRRASGLPALCVGWGPIADAGYLARNPEIRKRLESRTGGSALVTAQVFEVLEQLLLLDIPDLAIVRLDRGGLRNLLAATKAPKFGDLMAAGEAASTGAELEELQRWVEELGDRALAERLVEALRREVGEILRIDPAKLEPTRPLAELGLDSLMGVELMTAVKVRFGIEVPVMALSEVGTIERLARRLVRELRRKHLGTEAPDPGGIEAQVRVLASQHAVEVGAEDVAAFVEDMRVKAREDAT